jgi:hypothetical protein
MSVLDTGAARRRVPGLGIAEAYAACSEGRSPILSGTGKDGRMEEVRVEAAANPHFGTCSRSRTPDLPPKHR